MPHTLDRSLPQPGKTPWVPPTARQSFFSNLVTLQLNDKEQESTACRLLRIKNAVCDRLLMEQGGLAGMLTRGIDPSVGRGPGMHTFVDRVQKVALRDCVLDADSVLAIAGTMGESLTPEDLSSLLNMLGSSAAMSKGQPGSDLLVNVRFDAAPLTCSHVQGDKAAKLSMLMQLNKSMVPIGAAANLTSPTLTAYTQPCSSIQ